MNTRHLAHTLFFVLGCASSIAESAPSAPSPEQYVSSGCMPLGISKSWKDLPYNADIQDTNEQLYLFTLFKCDGSQNANKIFLLRVESVASESGKTKQLDKLMLPWVSPDRAQYMEPTCNIPMGGEMDMEGPSVVGAIGRLVQVQAGVKYKVENIWAWSFDPKTKKLHLLHPDKTFYCDTDGAYAP